jgi:hypothetical protein
MRFQWRMHTGSPQPVKKESGAHIGIEEFAKERLRFEPDDTQAIVLRGGRRGQSSVMALKAVHRAFTVAGSLTLVLTPSGRQSGEFLRKAEAFVQLLGIKGRGDGVNELSIAFPNGSRIVGLPENETTVRGFSAVSLMLIDEASRVRDEFYRAVRPMLAVGDGDLWLISTPNGKRGFFWEEWERGTEAWERISVKAPDCPRISKRFLEEEKANATDDWYRQEYLCEFVDQEGAFFTREMIEGLFQVPSLVNPE